MAGERTTGMDQAQNRDPGAVRQGRGKAAVAFFQRNLNPWSDAHKVKKAEKRAKQEAAASQTEKSAAPNLDPEEIKGGHLDAFRRHFIAAIRAGHDELSSADDRSPANLIREVVTRQDFIDTIAQGTLPTPFEEVDEDYRAMMHQKRQRLAYELGSASADTKHLIGYLDTSDIDILFSAFIGSAPYPQGERSGAIDIWKRRDENGNNRYPDWPAKLPMPPDAFFMFLESVARLQTSENGEKAEKAQGTFIGEVCKYLALESMRSFTEKQSAALRQLADGNAIKLYIQGQSSEHIEAAITVFVDQVRALFDLPTDQMDPELGVPGLGYSDNYNSELENWDRQIKEAKARLATINLRLGEANQREQYARTRMEEAQVAAHELLAAVQEAEQTGSVVIKGRELGLDELRDLQMEANGGRNQAAMDLLDATTQQKHAAVNVQKAETAHDRKVMDAKAYARRSEPERYAELLGSEFRAFLQNQGGDETLQSVDSAADKIDRMPNKAVTDIVEAARDVLKRKEALKPARFDKEPLSDNDRQELEELVRRIERLPARFDKNQLTQEDMGILGTVAAMLGMVPAKLGPDQLPEEQRRQLGMAVIEMERLPVKLSGELPLEKRRGELEQYVISGERGGTHLEPLTRMTKEEEISTRLRNRVELQGVVDRVSGMLGAILIEDVRVREEYHTFGYAKKQFDKELAGLKASIDDAALPLEVKERLGSVYILLSRKGPIDNAEMLEKMINSIDAEYAHPLKKAAKRSLDELRGKGYGQYTGLSNLAWVNAKITFEQHGPRTGEAPERTKKWHEKARAFMARWIGNLISPMCWVGAGVWLFDRVVRRDWQKIWNDNPWYREIEVVKKKDGREVVNRKWPNWIRGLSNLVFKAYLISAVAGYMGTRGPTKNWYDWINPVHWAGRLTLTPITKAFNDGKVPKVRPKRPLWEKLLTPWTWLMPTKGAGPKVWYINDHPSNHKTLHKRGDAYYKQNYGVGTRDVEGLKTSRQERLDWLRRHPDVLKFFQERIDGRRVVSIEKPKAGPRTCTRHRKPKKGKTPRNYWTNARVQKKDGEDFVGTEGNSPRIRLPKSCTVDPFKIKTRAALLNYKYGDKDEGWEPGNKVCCTLRLVFSTQGMRDRGLKLNPAMSDAVVDWLMAIEKGGKKIDYTFLTSKKTMLKWKEMWFLVSSGEEKIIRDTDLTKKDNVLFLLIQGSDATNLVYPLCANKALSPRLLHRDKRDAFVQEWIAEVKRLMPAAKLEEMGVQGTDTTVQVPKVINPLEQKIPKRTLGKAFENVFGGKKDDEKWFTNRTQAYKRQKVMDAVPFLKLQTDEAKDALADEMNSDILDLVMKFTKSSPYIIEQDRSDEFVLLLEAQKRRFGNAALVAYNPLAAEPSFKLQNALKLGYIRKKGPEQLKPGKGTVIKEGAKATVPKTAQYTEAVARFYETNSEFSKLVDNAIDAMFKSRTQSRLMTNALGQVFQNDREAMNKSIKAHLFNAIDKKRANISHVRMTTDGGNKKLLFPPMGHRARRTTVRGVRATIQNFLSPMFRQSPRRR